MVHTTGGKKTVLKNRDGKYVTLSIKPKEPVKLCLLDSQYERYVLIRTGDNQSQMCLSFMKKSGNSAVYYTPKVTDYGTLELEEGPTTFTNAHLFQKMSEGSSIYCLQSVNKPGQYLSTRSDVFILTENASDAEKFQ